MISKMKPLILAALALVVVGVVLLAVLGGDSGDSVDSGDDPAPSVPGGADSGDVEVIEGWATALKDGDIEKASTYWALPSTASNGTPTLTLQTEEQVQAFNEALPCGADLKEATTDDEGQTTATFELTDRPGGGCGPGTGGEAATIFKIEDGKITDWRRAPNPGEDPSAPPAPERIT